MKEAGPSGGGRPTIWTKWPAEQATSLHSLCSFTHLHHHLMHRKLPSGIVLMTTVGMMAAVRLGRNSLGNIGMQEIIQHSLFKSLPQKDTELLTTLRENYFLNYIFPYSHRQKPLCFKYCLGINVKVIVGRKPGKFRRFCVVNVSSLLFTPVRPETNKTLECEVTPSLYFLVMTPLSPWIWILADLNAQNLFWWKAAGNCLGVCLPIDF